MALAHTKLVILLPRFGLVEVELLAFVAAKAFAHFCVCVVAHFAQFLSLCEARV